MKPNAVSLSQTLEQLTPIAQQHTPNGSTAEAVLDQWFHAIATNSQLFCNKSIANPVDLKNEILSVLKTNNLYQNESQFYELIFGSLALKPQQNPKFRFIDLFAGVGGIRLGFQEHGGACVFSSEFEKNAQQTYKANHGELPFGDITQVKPEDIPDHDILLAGFPCQPFSHAGLKLGVEDTRGTLFHNIANILEVKRPKFALLENVKGLVSHDKGYTLKIILRKLTKLGYSCSIPKTIINKGTNAQIQKLAKEMVLKSIDFSVPQNRQRIYIVLWLDKLIDKFDYPEPTKTDTCVGDILEDNPDESLTISDKLWSGHQRRKIENEIKGKGFGYGLVTPKSKYTNTISARYYKDGSEILISQVNKNPRKLSPREAARLQGFPDSFILHSSKVQTYKQFGNSVSVPVVSAIAKQVSLKLENINCRT
jgi:DNA (cytosine-5)-methyltransferase 1